MDFGKLNSWLQVKQNTDLARIQMLNEETRRVVDYELEVVGERGAEVWAPLFARLVGELCRQPVAINARGIKTCHRRRNCR